MSHRYEIYHIGNGINICMVTYCSWTYSGDHFEMFRNIESLCHVTGTNSVVGQFYFKTNHRKRSDLWLSEAEGSEEGWIG